MATPMMVDRMHDGSSEPARDSAVAASRLDRDRTLEAVRGLEAAAGLAAGGDNWLRAVAVGLSALESAMLGEQRELNRPDALLAMIAAEQPRRFSTRIRNLREQYDDLVRQAASLRSQLDDVEDVEPTAGDLRHRIGWIVRALHHCRAQQTDLVYEALELDLGER